MVEYNKYTYQNRRQYEKIFIAIYFRNVFNLVCFAIAVSINRIAIVVANKVSKGGDKNNDFDI